MCIDKNIMWSFVNLFIRWSIELSIIDIYNSLDLVDYFKKTERATLQTESALILHSKFIFFIFVNIWQLTNMYVGSLL